MANAFNREEVILFDRVLEKFNADNTVAAQATRFSQPGKQMQRRGDTVWRPTPQISTTVDGLDITNDIGSITQMSVPASLSTIANVPFQLDALEARDDLYMERKAESAAQALSSRVNKMMADNIKIWGSLTVAQSDPLTGYDDISLVDAMMVEQEVLGNDKTMVLNPRDYNRMGGNLAQRTLMPRSEKALDDTVIGPVSNFNTFKTSYGPVLEAAAGSGITVSETQSYVPVSTVTASTGETANVDNRTMNLTVSDVTGVKPGDKFTIAGVNAISHISKNPTGELKTFTVIEVGSAEASTLRIAPAIVVAGASDAETDYANVDSAALKGSAITFLNTKDTQSNLFFMNNSIEIFGGRLAFPEDGLTVMRMTTDSGIEIIFARQGDVLSAVTTYRLTMFMGVTNLNPEMNGVLIGGQEA